MARNCWIKSTNELTELKSLFRDADKRVSLYCAENLNAREEHLESRLLTILDKETSLAYQTRINEERVRLRQPTLSIDFKHITHTERTSGADIGVVASLRIPGEVALTKAILAQSKRLHSGAKGFTEDSSYDEIFSERSSTPQWERLLNVTPSSVYLLFGPDRLRLGQRIRSFGIQVLTAQNVKGFVDAGMSRLTAAVAHQRGSDFPDWIVDEFICCNAGDPSDSVINIARGRNSNFTVRNTIEILIQGSNFEPRLS
jgi:hypothetical protein